jgi:hypothetical protein
MLTFATGLVLAFALTGIVAGMLARRLSRRMKARLGQELASPLVVAFSGDWISSGEGPRWDPSWECYATAPALCTAVTTACPDRGVVVTNLENQLIRQSRLVFAYQDLNHPALAQLCDHLSLGDFAKEGSGDLERLLRVTSHVRGLAEHTEQHASNQMSYGAPPDAFSILAGVASGQTLQCHAYTLLLIQCLAALGYVARQSSCGYCAPREHVVAEVWSSE